MSEYFAYVLKGSNGKYYKGMTNNLEKRILEHNSRTYGYTLNGRPWRLIYSETLPDRISALRRERFLKSGMGRNFIKNIVD